MMALCGQMSEQIADRSEGAITLQLTPTEDPLALYRTGEVDMAFCTTQQMTEIDPELQWLSLPMLFADPEQYLACVNAEESPVKQSQAVADELGGSVLGAFYDCGWMMASAKEGAEAPDPLRGVLFGVDFRYNGREQYLALGTRDTAFGNAKKLWQLLSQEEAGTIEFLPQETESLPEAAIAVTLSRHRMGGRFLILRRDAVEEESMLYLQQAVSETLGQACRQRMEQEESLTAALCTASGAEFRSEPLQTLSKNAAANYRGDGSRFGLSETVLTALEPYLIGR